ncbi:condensation domain-containing protein [Amycolatopsis sp. cmx-4-68]|uniref:condensation domain-containing protein n=1 Tax=Amycolatopsis sp. cmx-4-68 TaxID=2790938 RepID=UPI0039796394
MTTWTTTGLTAELCAVLTVRLGQPIGPDDDFFAMGGDSLIALRVLADAAERGIRLTLLDLLRHPSAAGLAAHLSAGAGEQLADLDAGPGPAGVLPAADLALAPAGVAELLTAGELPVGMIYLCDSSGDPELYHSAIGFDVGLPFDEEWFAAALTGLCARHPALRSAFDLGSYSAPAQVVWAEPRAVPVTVVDAGEDPADTAWRQHLPIDWRTAPLTRGHVRRGTGSFRVTLVVHHAIVDGWSYGRLVVDLLTLYHGAVTGSVPALPVLPEAVHRRHAEAEQRAVADAGSAEFWRARADVPPLLFDRGRFAGAANAERSVRWTLPAGLVAGLRDAAARVRVPVKALALAAHQWALGGLAGRHHDVVTGVVVNTRPATPGSDLVVGLFLNTVPMRADRLDRTWAELAEAAHTAERESLPHHAYPLAHVERALGRPAFDAVFNFTRFHVYDELDALDSLRLGGWSVVGKPSFPLRVDFELGGRAEGDQVEVAYDPALLAVAAAARFARLFGHALRAAAADPFRSAGVPPADVPDRHRKDGHDGDH